MSDSELLFQYHSIYPDVIPPKYATEHSSCFDIRAYIPEGISILTYDNHNNLVQDWASKIGFVIRSNYRALIPTGLIFVLQERCGVRLHSRSGLSLKYGIGLANSEGIIDADYTDPVYVILENRSSANFVLENQERICQGEVVVDTRAELKPIVISPTNPHPRKTNRTGGFGSTGTN